ncbi:MAG: RNA pseudouridine synthase [Myxococcota bacterium]
MREPAERPPAALPVLHDAEGLVAVDKPAGLPSTGRTPDDPGSVRFRLEAQLGARVWAVHQLDRGTSGVNLFVRKKALVASWQARLAAGRKTYLAFAHGVPAWDRREVDLALDRVRGRPALTPSGKPARTQLRVRSRGPAHALVEAWPRTGRTHQIRLHLAALGHPLVGERLHRDPPCARHPGPALHCARIAAAGRRLEAPLAEALEALGRTLALPLP